LRLRSSESLRAVPAVASSLRRRSAQHISPRDLKPENICLWPFRGATGERSKDPDFGIAKLSDEIREAEDEPGGMLDGGDGRCSCRCGGSEAGLPESDHRSEIYSRDVVLSSL